MMDDFKQDYISYRLSKAEEAFLAAELMATNNLLTSSVNRCYYACFYMVDALLFSHGIKSKTHSGAKTQLNLNFIKTGIIPIEFGELFAELADLRQEGDYGSKFEIREEDIKYLLTNTRQFMDHLKKLIC